MEPKEKKLTERQKTFCLEYVNCGNASEAARKAGYKGDANTIGPRLLANVGVKEEVKRLTRKKVKTIKSAKDLKEFWSRLLDDSEADMKDRLKASELLGKTRGMFLERREITGSTKLVVMPPEEK